MHVTNRKKTDSRVPKGVKIVKVATAPSKCRAPRARCTAACRPASASSRTTACSTRSRDSDEHRAFHGLARAWSPTPSPASPRLQEGARHRRRRLPRRGEGQEVIFALGYSHPVVFDDSRRHPHRGRQADAPHRHRRRRARSARSRRTSAAASARSVQAEGRPHHRRVLKKKAGKTGAKAGGA